MVFTKSQLKAINHRSSNLQLIACAGSGKTEVVARHIVNLLKSGPESIAPKNIVAFTFTEKAAGELKERIYTRCKEELGSVVGLAEMYVGTIHGFCLDLLKSEAPRFLKYGVLSEVQQKIFVDRNCKKSGLTSSTDLNGNPLKRYKDTKFYTEALSILREGESIEKKLNGCSIVDGLEAYKGLLEEKRYLDYSAILEEAVFVLYDDVILQKRMGERIKHVIVDEYQDVNPVQEAIVWQLHEFGAKVCVVGDDDQTIYQWRGSDVNNILTFSKRYPSVEQVRLEENFRSSRGIIETARDFIAKNTERLPKAMIPADAQPFEKGDIVALPFNSQDEEAGYIAGQIKTLRGVAFKEGDSERGLAWSDMAVLLRSVKGNGTPITKALDEAGIPFVVVGMNNLFDTAEAEASRQLFYFMADKFGVGEESLLASWVKAGTGSDEADLKKAIGNASRMKTSMKEKDEKRFSFYSIQRIFLTFLEEACIREEKVPDGRGEILFYNFGKFSQVISDFETINYHSKPIEKYASFADFLKHRAKDAYPEGWQDSSFANPDAVRIMTVHQAKGMQWPVVFIPALIKNRFPSMKWGGKGVWHLLPADGIKGKERFEGNIEDERRLFYVAMTRSQKFLHMTWAPVAGNQLFQKKSEFWENVLESKWVKRIKPDYSDRRRLAPTPKVGISNVVLSFSDLKYFFECPYQFKLRILYGFNAPIHEALGYGKSLHDALAEVHMRVLAGSEVKPGDADGLVETHLHTPYAYEKLRENLERSARKVVGKYIADNQKLFSNLEFSEKTVEISLGDGVSVNGRIDLVRRLDTGETTIVDLKSTDRAQPEEVTETQLHIYALGYKELTGRNADKVEIYNLDEGKRKPRSVDEDFIEEVKANVRRAAEALREGSLQPAPVLKKCKGCDYPGLCTAGEQCVTG